MVSCCCGGQGDGERQRCTLQGEYAYANDFEVRLKALTDLTKEYRLCGPRLVMGGINFAWLAVWINNQLEKVATFYTGFCWPAGSAGG
jgi:hypothetical protein